MTKHLTLLGDRMTRIFSIFLFIGLAWGQNTNRNDDLSKIIHSYADELMQKIPLKSVVFIADHSDFDGKTSYFGKYVAVKLSNYLSENQDFTIVDRNSIKMIMDEQKLQYSGAITENIVVQLGNLHGANILVTGTVTEFAKKVNIDSKVINIETSNIIASAEKSIEKTDDITHLIASIIMTTEQREKELEELRKKKIEEMENEFAKQKEMQNKQLEELRTDVLQSIENEHNEKQLRLEDEQNELITKFKSEEDSLRKILIDLESVHQEKSEVLNKIEIKRNSIADIDSKIQQIYKELDKVSDKIPLLRTGMTVSEVRNIIGDRFREEYDCGSAGKYLLAFENQVLISVCRIGEKFGYNATVTDCLDCGSNNLLND